MIAVLPRKTVAEIPGQRDVAHEGAAVAVVHGDVFRNGHVFGASGVSLDDAGFLINDKTVRLENFGEDILMNRKGNLKGQDGVFAVVETGIISVRTCGTIGHQSPKYSNI